MNLFEKILLYILSFIFSPIGIITWIISLFSKDPEKKQVGRICLYIALISFILLAGLGIVSFFTMTNHYYTIVTERMIILGEHPISKELRYIRICLVVLVIVLLFFNGERVTEISTNHDSIENVSTSNMTQIAENTFAIQEYNPSLSSERTVKIFNYNPDTNQLTLVKEFSTNDPESYTYQLNKSE